MRLPLSLAALAAAVLAACGDGGDGPGPLPYVDDAKLTVLTRNVFLGAELSPVLRATTPFELAAATDAVWQRVQANRFPERAARIADEIAAAQPDLVGLQEVTLWRTQTPGDSAFGGTPATAVALDYLRILLDRLAERRLAYVPVVSLELADIEAPIAGGTDLRMTDRDVILARAGVPTSNPRGAPFAALGLVTVLGTDYPVKRGWSSVEATIGGRRIVFVNTHLEAFELRTATGALARPAQAAELVALLAGEEGRVAVVGDLNSAPGTEGHAALTGAGFADAWEAVRGADPGLTCCFPEDLTRAAPLSTRIDDVLVRGALTPTSATVVGEEAADRTPGGLWPSDHAGVVATVEP
ncbi:MAG TPA: endonuclease/exonuclease/phosphatase family protein [Anaeromyxobacter sp.]|nr:endonuclease/exonuclease/phosphatase family protein [Anaeromyxobacter sp.]